MIFLGWFLDLFMIDHWLLMVIGFWILRIYVFNGFVFLFQLLIDVDDSGPICCKMHILLLLVTFFKYFFTVKKKRHYTYFFPSPCAACRCVPVPSSGKRELHQIQSQPQNNCHTIFWALLMLSIHANAHTQNPVVVSGEQRFS